MNNCLHPVLYRNTGTTNRVYMWCRDCNASFEAVKMFEADGTPTKEMGK